MSFARSTCVRLLLTVCALASATPDGHAAGEKHAGIVERETLRFVETLERGGNLRVVNPFGDVYARFGGYEPRVEVLATRQRLESTSPRLTVEVEATPKGLDVIVAHPGFENRSPNDAATRDRVDLVVFVPDGTRLDVRTRNGQIEAKKLRGDVTASSVAGDVRLTSIRGHVQAKTARGRMTVTLVAGATTEPQELVTETGDLEVWIPADAHADVALATSGELCTDFSIAIEHHDFAEPSKVASATVGRGGPALSLRSMQGRVCLRRLQQHFKPES